MMNRTTLTLALTLLAGCAGDADTTYVEGAIRAVDDMPIEGATICVAEHAELACATTNEAGEFFIDGIPIDEDVTITYEAEGFLPYRVMYGAADQHPRLTTKVFRAFELVEVGAIHGVDIDASAGMIVVTSRGTPAGEPYAARPDTSFRVSGEHRPVYFSRHGVPDPTLESTSESGSAFVVNLPAGEYEIEFDHADYDCAPHHAWASGAPNTVRAEVAAGQVTFVSQVCLTPKAE